MSEKKKFDGAVVSQAEAIIGDANGCLKIIARDNQLPLLKEGTTITLMNAHAKVNGGFLKIEVDKWGIIKPAAPEDVIQDAVNLQNNLSEVEYELVPLKTSDAPKSETDTRGGRGRGRGRGDRGRGGRGGHDVHESDDSEEEKEKVDERSEPQSNRGQRGDRGRGGRSFRGDRGRGRGSNNHQNDQFERESTPRQDDQRQKTTDN